MKNFWSILFVVIAILVGIQLLRVALGISFWLIRLLLPVAVIGFAIYGLKEYIARR